MKAMSASRTEVRRVLCPACVAKPGEPCTGSRGQPRESNHRERVDAGTQTRATVDERTARCEQRMRQQRERSW